MKADVYRNGRENCVSVRSREAEDYGKVVAHEGKVHLRGAEFIVQPSGAALIRGEWDESVTVVYGEYVTYDSDEHEQFYAPELDTYVDSAERVAVTREGIYAEGLSK